ncbi:MAG: nucleoside triphosphate pyrophosphohydrolase [Rickettsiales bacterium]|nr:nucleoside triphosphate pyrophosphohydrolase [Rickettsiales bacterium]
MSASLSAMQALLTIMKKLRDKDNGCPWDVEQTHASIAPYCIEEAYEVVEAINNNDMAELKSELGDLLLQVVFHSQMASEAGEFAFEDVAQAIGDKMTRRHPHVFGDSDVNDAEGVTSNWEAIKEEERAQKADTKTPSILDDVPKALPALTRAEKLQKRAARVGFDWPQIIPVYDKIKEELDELKEATTQEHKEEELGDLLFVLANLARHMKIDPEEALRKANRKFERRFNFIERSYNHSADAMKQAGLDELDKRWHEAKLDEKKRA